MITLSTTDLPMFFSASHAELATTLAHSAAELRRQAPHREAVIPWLGGLGLLDHAVPGAHPDVRSLCLVREALGQASPLADAIFAVQGLGAQALVRTPQFPHRNELLAEARQGRITLGFALTEPEAGSDVASLRTTARRDGDSWLLDGEKIFISNVGIADYFTVFARVEPAPSNGKAISAFWVPKDAPGLELLPIALSGGGDHPLGALRMKACRLSQGALIGEIGGGMRLALGTLDVFRTSVGAAAVGMARRALDESIAHVRKRVQFGKPLAEFQLTQAALADMATELDAARLLVYRAAWEKDQKDQAGGSQASKTSVAMAKMFATEAASRIIDRAVQLFGGSGVVASSVVAELLRDVRPLRIYEGTTEIQKLIIGGELVSQGG